MSVNICSSALYSAKLEKKWAYIYARTHKDVNHRLVAGVRPIISYGGRDRIHYDRSSTTAGGGGGVGLLLVVGWVLKCSRRSTFV